MRFLFFCLLLSLFSCSSNFIDRGEKMFKGKLQNGSELQLTYFNGNATDYSSIWVSIKQGKNKSVIIDRIDYTFRKESLVKFTQLNDTLIKLILCDTAETRNPIDSFLLNLNRRIMPNDGYEGARAIAH